MHSALPFTLITFGSADDSYRRMDRTSDSCSPPPRCVGKIPDLPSPSCSIAEEQLCVIDLRYGRPENPQPL